MTASVLTDQELRGVVEAASLAPSVHNTQPWSFSWDGTTLSVLEDPARGLPVLDPTGRERVLSCGAAVLNARLARAALGWQCKVELQPDPARPELLARLIVSGKGPEQVDVDLAASIPRRYTDRGVFEDREVPGDVVRRLVEAAEREGAWLRPVERLEDRVALAVLLSQADEVEHRDPAYQAELAHWRTRERTEAGIPDAALAADAPAVRGSDYTLRDFHLAEPARAAAVTDDPPRPEHPLALVLGTDADDPESWIVAGMALGRVLLQATAEGLAASPMTQVVEIERLRLRLRQEMGLAGLPQVVLRIGYGHEAMTTRRRPVDQVLQVL